MMGDERGDGGFAIRFFIFFILKVDELKSSPVVVYWKAGNNSFGLLCNGKLNVKN